MKKLIHHLRTQNEEVRRHVLHISILIIGILMITLWVYSLGSKLTDPNTKEKIKQDLTPFTVLKDNIVESSKNIFEN